MKCDCGYLKDFPKKYIYSALSESGELRQLYVNENTHQKLQKIFKKYPSVKLIIKDEGKINV